MSKQMSATSCSGQAVHPVELLRDGKGVFGIIGHRDDGHEPENLTCGRTSWLASLVVLMVLFISRFVEASQ